MVRQPQHKCWEKVWCTQLIHKFNTQSLYYWVYQLLASNQRIQTKNQYNRAFRYL